MTRIILLRDITVVDTVISFTGDGKTQLAACTVIIYYAYREGCIVYVSICFIQKEKVLGSHL